MWKFWDDARAGLIGDCELADLESGIARSPGHCMTMGTASTMTSAAEALGMTAARGRLDPGGGLGALPDGRGHRPADRADGLGRPAAGDHPDPGGVRGRGGHRAGPGRLDQRADPPGRHGRPGRRPAHPGRLRRDLAPGAGARQHPAQRRVPDGGLLLRRRPARAARPAGRRCPARCTWTGPRSAAGRSASRSPEPRSTTTTSSAPRSRPCRPRAAWPCCAATWPPTAR